MSFLYDPIRRKWVIETPEEKVRQRVIHKMTQVLGYPKGLIAIEKELASLMPVSVHRQCKRRADIFCYRSDREGLSPLLIIECKARFDCAHTAQQQVLGYNENLIAPFIAIATDAEIRTFWREKEKFVSVPFLPPYAQLLACLPQ